MKRLLAFFTILELLALFGLTELPAAQSTVITATITVTNTGGTVNGETITVNSDTRTWTNSVSFPATQIFTNSAIGGCATNLFNAVSAAPFLNLASASLTNGITLTTVQPNGPLSVSLSSGWGLVVLSTNFLTSAQVVRVPFSVEYSTNQTYIASALAQGLESSTYGLSATAPFGSNYVNVTQPQTITGRKTFIQPTLTNALSWSSTNSNPISTNGINYGNAFSSPGTNFHSEQFGLGAVASSNNASAFGAGSWAGSDSATAIGSSANATGSGSTSLGSGAQSLALQSIAVGVSSLAEGVKSVALGHQATAVGNKSTAIGDSASTGNADNSTAIGQGATAGYTNSTAIGQGASTTATNQLMLGQAGQTVLAPGVFQAGSISNAVFSSTNAFPAGSDISFGRSPLSSLANGNNADIPVGTNVFIEVSGPSSAFTINGIAGGRDGKLLYILNRTGFNLTIAHDSGVDATPANRIYCLTAADKTVTGNSAATLIYNANNSRWILLSFTQ